MIRRSARPRFRRACVVLFATVFAILPARAFAQGDTLVVEPGVPDAPIPNRLASGAEGLWYSIPFFGNTPEAYAAAAATSPKLDADIGAREQHTIVFDSARHRYLAFGGTIVPGGAVFNDVWTRPAGTGAADWTPLAVGGTRPTARRGHTAVYDPIGDRVLVFGGTPPAQNDVWELTLAGTPTWVRVARRSSEHARQRGSSSSPSRAHVQLPVAQLFSAGSSPSSRRIFPKS